jgi:hypothetical protein
VIERQRGHGIVEHTHRKRCPRQLLSSFPS